MDYFHVYFISEIASKRIMVEYLVPTLIIENYASEVKKRANKRSNYNK